MQKIRLYDATKLDRKHMMFSNKQLLTLLLPIMVEQLLNSFMGMADTMMVSNVGSAAISAVSLVDSINVLVIQAFFLLSGRKYLLIFRDKCFTIYIKVGESGAKG